MRALAILVEPITIDALSWTSWQPYNYDYLITDYNSNLIEHRYKQYLYRYLRKLWVQRCILILFGKPFNASTDLFLAPLCFLHVLVMFSRAGTTIQRL